MKSEKIQPGNEIGWKEWIALPELNIPAIKAKVDTGARTSSLHSYHLETYREKGIDMVCFSLHPLQKRTDIEIVCTAPIVDTRVVRDSGGHAEERHVIETNLRMGEHEWTAEITLTSRDDMLFRMLLGRTAIVSGGFLVNPARSYLHGKKLKSTYRSRKTAKG
ncbi:MAG TPA: RimK/LysX family protein [Gammaproteobacteria bacterium]|nr:RimK/LysX family protein [Gammaproteobacteria bacterium]